MELITCGELVCTLYTYYLRPSVKGQDGSPGRDIKTITWRLLVALHSYVQCR